VESHRASHLRGFYSVLSRLEEKLGGMQTLDNCSGQVRWPKRGVYFFFEQGEQRSDTGSGPRVVRVGTHALRAGPGTELWTRLSQHRGRVRSGGGSIFRLIIGAALIGPDGHECATWGKGSSASREVRNGELALECAVSSIIRAMPFLWLAVEDEPGPQSLRGYLERNAIALLSNHKKSPLDSSSEHWLGRLCDRERVRKSGLWNSNHVDESYDPAFLDCLDRLVR
jgi:hypothetical protein